MIVNVIIDCSVHVTIKKKRKKKKSETPMLEVIFVTLTENSFVVTNDTQGCRKYPHHRK